MAFFAAAGLNWNQDSNPNGRNAFGVYDAKTGTFEKKRSTEAKSYVCGKGTARDGGTRYTLGNSRGSYSATADYTNAVVMVSIYPEGNNKHIDVYWKNTKGEYIGGKNPNGNNNSDPNYSIRISLE